MPRSKRNKVISLTKTASKGKDAKSAHIDLIRGALDEYKHVFVFTFENLRTSFVRDVRADLKESRLFLGKNSVAQVALGRSPEEEVRDNLRNVSSKLDGDSGLLFTNRSKKEITKYFKNFSRTDYAKSGAISPETITLQPGVMEMFSPYEVDHLRKLGLVLEIEDGHVFLRTQFLAAQEGAPLTAEQAKVLVHIKRPLSQFRLSLVCYWSDGHYEEL